MELGVALPNAGRTVVTEDLVRLATGAEAAGLHSVWVMDRWLRPRGAVTMPGVPVPVELPPEGYACVLDPIDVLAHLAALTRSVRLGTSAVLALLQPPVLLARRLATVDQLSHGRVVAGLAPGWMREEFAAAGTPAGSTGRRLEEHLAALRAVWGPNPVEIPGGAHPVAPSDVGPKPFGRAAIPVLLGYSTAAGIRRAAWLADGLHPYRTDLDELAADLAVFRAAAAEAGRDPAALPVVLRGDAVPDQDAGEGRPLFRGTVEQWAQDARRVAELGVGHLVLQVAAPPETTLDTLADLRRRLDR
ncbi:TIGR03619 family F420-dependent LLM class oxidoreductase [Pseudonocardia xinjiangensis]|uniref:TIGR03619 family F420-dependent LLM class oxidoreductase n=1 Tax=Pseudonocardia xinjiangensis TaxID=75289 RepID=UPI003D8C8059